MNPAVLAVAAVVVLALLLVLTRGKKSSSGAVASVALDPTSYQPFQLVSRHNVNHNTVQFRFALASATQRVGLPIGKHMLLKFIDTDGKPVSRAYTPVSSDDDLGHFDLLVKLYPQGKMSQHLAALQVGQSIEARGPQGSLEYVGRGVFRIKRRAEVQQIKAEGVGMIAGGSGITPMLQLLRAVGRDAADHTRLSLLFANVTEADILLRTELDELREARSLTRVTYTLDKPSESWTGPSGFVTPALIGEHLPAPGPATLILLCGPKPMIESMEKHLLGMGYTDDMIFKY